MINRVYLIRATYTGQPRLSTLLSGFSSLENPQGLGPNISFATGFDDKLAQSIKPILQPRRPFRACTRSIPTNMCRPSRRHRGLSCSCCWAKKGSASCLISCSTVLYSDP